MCFLVPSNLCGSLVLIDIFFLYFDDRQIQVDAMLPNARYPIILQPLPLGVDRREEQTVDRRGEQTTGQPTTHKECFWLSHSEKPIPIFEMSVEYVPQDNMFWVPNLRVCVSPIKVQLDVEYILRVAEVVLNSIPKIEANIDHILMSTNHKLTVSNWITGYASTVCFMFYLLNFPC